MHTYLSYWKDLKGLHDFAGANAHRLGAINYNKNKYPHMGIMHETYHAPRGQWETIAHNMTPWGLSKLKFSSSGSDLDIMDAYCCDHIDAVAEQLQTFRPASTGIEHSTMFERMRRNAARELR